MATPDCTPTKTCTKCGKTLPATVEYFSRNPSVKSGLRPDCKSCTQKQARRYRRENPETVRQTEARRDKEKRRAKSREYYVRNAEKLQAKARKARQENLELYRARDRNRYNRRRSWSLEYHREYRGQNREYIRKRQSQYNEQNRSLINKRQRERNKLPRYKIHSRTAAHRRLARKRNLPDTLTSGQWERCLTYWNNLCAYCNAGDDIQADHVIPLSNPECPGTVIENMIPACRHCNTSKSNQPVSAWLFKKFGKRKAKQILERIQTYFEWVKSNNEPA